jgi:hypothetical protein
LFAHEVSQSVCVYAMNYKLSGRQVEENSRRLNNGFDNTHLLAAIRPIDVLVTLFIIIVECYVTM